MSSNNFFLQVPEKHPSKQIIIRKMKHMGQVDKQIRRNQKNLFKFINRNNQLNPNPQVSPKRRLMTDCSDSKIIKHTHKATRINSIHSEIKREQVHSRQRKNEEIFFKKHTYDMHTLLNPNRPTHLSKRYSLQLEGSKKKLEQSLPFMLRKRPAKIEKQMDIINHTYKDSLKEIKNREVMKYSLSLQDRQDLIDSMKGTKVYYQFLKEWRSDQQDNL